VARMGLVVKPERKRSLRKAGVEGSIILQWILEGMDCEGVD